MDGPRPPIRLAELVAALSLGIDLGFGQPMEHILRQCRIALRLSELVGLTDEERAAVYYTALLVNVGCHTDAHEQAKWFGDDIALKSTKYDHEQGSIGDALSGLRLIGAGGSPLHRVRVAAGFAIQGRREVDGMIAQHARLARALGDELDLPPSVLDGLASSYERWDGKGYPGERSGTDIPLSSRIVQLAEFTEVAHRTAGLDGATTMAERRSGTQFDPNIAAVLCADAEKVFHGIEDVGSWDAVIDEEPSLEIHLSEDQLDAALTAISNFVDLKSPFFLGHGVAVAALVAGAGPRLDLSPTEVSDARRAAFVQGFGRLGISNAIWDKPGPLGAGEWERVRLQPYLTERMLSQAASLAPITRIAVQHRERMNGSGYPRGLSGNAIPRPARLLAAADVYQSMREPRPHRPALTRKSADDELRSEVAAGRLDAESVDAVLAAAGHPVLRPRGRADGLTPREIEVLRLVARGMSNKAVAAALVISRKTASNHIEHIYTKIGVTNRTAASIFAVKQGLLPELDVDADAAG